MFTLKLRLNTTASILQGWLLRTTGGDSPLIKLPKLPTVPRWLSGTWSKLSPIYFARDLELWWEPGPNFHRRVSQFGATFSIRITVEALTETSCLVTFECSACEDTDIRKVFLALLADLVERWPEAIPQLPETMTLPSGWTGFEMRVRLLPPSPGSSGYWLVPSGTTSGADAAPKRTSAELQKSRRRTGRPRVSTEYVRKIVEGADEATRKGIKLRTYADQVGVSVETIRSYRRRLAQEDGGE